mgnify:CR=1 FL=1
MTECRQAATAGVFLPWLTGLPALGAVALVAVCLSITSADELIGYKPGFRIQTLFKPDVCDHKLHYGDIIYLNYNATLANGTLIGSR